ncbi:hypothetical protein SOVF_150090 [Spinacia oleracea]|nr:hypothetical protein SOVF_150090 [Spinacia oleracea]
MSTPEPEAEPEAEAEAEVGDIRYKTYELPPSLGENPSDETLKALFSNYGWVWLCQITNKTGHNINFYNPYYGVTGYITPGATESYNSKGYLPYWSHSRRYEITYYNTAFEESKTMTIKDLDGNWLLSFEQPGVDEDIREVRPVFVLVAGINLTISDSGYEIFSVSRNCMQSRISWQKPIRE